MVDEGVIVKTAGGTTTLPLSGGDGLFDVRVGDIALADALAPFSQDLVDRGLDRLVVEGEVRLEEALTLDTVIVNGVRSGGLVVKTGGGESALPLIGDAGGRFEQRSGQFALDDGVLGGALAPIALSAAKVEAGLDRVLARDAAIRVEQDVLIESLVLHDAKSR